MRYGQQAKTVVETMFCVDRKCRLFNEPVEVRAASASWWAPSEWIDDPECKVCGGGLSEHPRDVTCDRCHAVTDDFVENEAGVWCVECHELMLAESLAAVGGRQLIEAEVRYNREAREQEGVL